MSSARIIGTGFYVPTKIVKNKELESFYNTTDKWITEKSGIKERRIAAGNELSSDLAIYAANRALRNASVSALDINLIIVATTTPDALIPSTSCIVQGKIGAANAVAIELTASCTGFIYGLAVADAMMQSNKQYKRTLVIGVDIFTRIVDWKDRTTSIFFGDGAGAVVLEETCEESGIKYSYIGSNGENSSVIRCLNQTRSYSNEEMNCFDTNKFYMNSRMVWDFTTEKFPELIKKVISENNMEIEDIDWIISHQANYNIIKTSLETLNIPMEKTYTNIQYYGNTAAASIPIALAEANQKGLLKSGQNIILVGFGGGLSYGAIYLKW